MLPVVFWLWASLRLGHLREWVLGWVPQSVFSLANGLSSVEAWYSTALDVEEVLAGIGSDHFMSWSLMSSSLLTRLIGPFLTVPWVDLGFLPGFVRCISSFILKSGSGLSLLLVLVNLGVGMGVFHRVVLLVCSLLLLFMYLGVGVWRPCLLLGLNYTPII